MARSSPRSCCSRAAVNPRHLVHVRLCDPWQVQANAAFVAAVPDSQRGQAYGLALGGMQVGQEAAMLAAAQSTGPWLAIAAVGTAGALAAALISVQSERGPRAIWLSSIRGSA